MLAIEYQFALEDLYEEEQNVSNIVPEVRENEWISTLKNWAFFPSNGGQIVDHLRELFHKSSICEVRSFMQAIYINKESCDVILILSDGSSFHAHGGILSFQSEYFSALLSERWETSQSTIGNLTRIDLLDCESRTLERILEYFYSGCYDKMINETDLVPCLLLSNRLLLNPLKAYLGTEIRGSINLTNAAEIFTLADRLQMDDLKADALHILVKNYDIIRKSTSAAAFIDENFGSFEISSLEILSAFYRRARERGITIESGITRISEILAISEEALAEADDRYQEAKAHNDLEIKECEELLQLEELHEKTTLMSSIFRRFNPSYCKERLKGLYFTRSNIQKQGANIDTQRKFLAQQALAYERLSKCM